MPASEQEGNQVGLILDTFDDVEVFPGDWRAEGSQDEAQFLYRRDRIVVRDYAEQAVREGARNRDGATFERDEVDLVGAVRLQVVGAQSLLDELDLIKDDLEAAELSRNDAGLDPLLYVCIHSCAAIEPEEPGTSDPLPPIQDGGGAGNPNSKHGVGVSVRILDTGIIKEPSHPHDWMKDVDGENDTAVKKALDAGRPIPQDGGHGTFTAGCVMVAAPSANVYVMNAAKLVPAQEEFPDELGAIFDSDLSVLLREAISADPDIIVINFAGTTRDNQPPVALTGLYGAEIKEREDRLVVLSPAGNEGDTRVAWPASFPWVVSVGALDVNGDLASFSNHGPRPSVDVYAPGDRFVNAYAEGEYKTIWEPPWVTRHFDDGLALWSGTSFSTPLVAGLIAARKSTTEQTVREAWKDLFAVAKQQMVAGAGPALFPGQELKNPTP